MKDPSDIPIIAETLFLNLNAKVEFSPEMNAGELKKGLTNWEKNAKFFPETMSHPHTN